MQTALTLPSDVLSAAEERDRLADRLVLGEQKLMAAGLEHPAFAAGFERWLKLLGRYEQLVLQTGEG